MHGRAYHQSVGRHPYPQLVGAYPQLVGYGPQLVGYGPQRVGAYPQQLANFAPPGALGFAPDPSGAMAYPLMGNNPGSTGTVLVDGVPSQVRQWPFPMPDAPLGPGASGTSANQAQLIVRPTRLTIAETTGPSVLTDINVGQRSQFINKGGSVPVAMFSNVATDSLVNFDTAQIGNSITLSYTNNGAASTIISSAMLCVTAAY